jgi:LuxR family transcriptional regulator, quorum-sensing system regulator SolR
MSISLLCDAYDAMQRAKTSEELRVEMEKFTRQAGFEHYCYALSITAPSLRPQLFTINGYPKKWIDHYFAHGYIEVDPLIRFAAKSTLPAIWSDHMFHSGKSVEFWEEARSFGLGSGLTFNIRDQPGVTGIFSLSRAKPLDLPPLELAAIVGRAQIFASLLHQAVVRIDLPGLMPDPNIALTARERECLKWAADGKTAWEIGQILSIAERTAVFHVNNVIRKLGASNKTQAIVRAVTLKLI